MNFQRGLDPKRSMGIGIAEKSMEVVKRLVSENVFDLVKQETHRKMEEQFEKEVGLKMKVKIDMDREGIYFEVYRPINKIDLEKITIRPFGRDDFLNRII